MLIFSRRYFRLSIVVVGKGDKLNRKIRIYEDSEKIISVYAAGSYTRGDIVLAYVGKASSLKIRRLRPSKPLNRH